MQRLTSKFQPLRISGLVLLAGFVLPVTGLPVSAQQEYVDEGSKSRISLSGRLHTLVQTVAAQSCYIASGTAVAEQQEALSISQEQLTRILNALENGDRLLGVPSPEDNSRAKKLLDELSTILAGMDSDLATLQSQSDLSAYEALQADVAPFADVSNRLATEIVGLYANPNEVNQRDAMAIGLAGRQRSFTQQLKESACQLALDPANADAQAALSETMGLFERSLVALRDGLPEIGLKEPPNEGIKDELNTSWAEWEALKSELNALASGGAADLPLVDELSASLLLHMNNVVSRYLLSIPGSENIYRVPLQAYAEQELMSWFDDPLVIEAIKAQNIEHASIDSNAIEELDQTWRAEAAEGTGPMIEDLLSREASLYLIEKTRGAAGFVTEVFIMDDKGLNVAQSAVTSDYWQGDEAKWQETYQASGYPIHISEAEFDDSTQAYQAQVSFPIRDPDTGRKIGAVTLGVNLQLLI